MMARDTPRTLQQQPRRDSDAQHQQQAGSGEFQHQAGGGGTGKPEQMGEGSYEGTREYNQRTKDYLEKADVERDAEAAKPRSEQEARELDEAEKEGRSHARK